MPTLKVKEWSDELALADKESVTKGSKRGIAGAHANAYLLIKPATIESLEVRFLLSHRQVNVQRLPKTHRFPLCRNIRSVSLLKPSTIRCTKIEQTIA